MPASPTFLFAACCPLYVLCHVIFEILCELTHPAQGDMVKLICCSNAMLDGTLQSAVESPAVRHEQVRRPPSIRSVGKSVGFCSSLHSALHSFSDKRSTLRCAAPAGNAACGVVERDVHRRGDGGHQCVQGRRCAAWCHPHSVHVLCEPVVKSQGQSQSRS